METTTTIIESIISELLDNNVKVGPKFRLTIIDLNSILSDYSPSQINTHVKRYFKIRYQLEVDCGIGSFAKKRALQISRKG